ncbi:hypothetical protein SAY87_001899 [Trapa incisa]|uniref:MaoC-like domain-containing protein n=2 Tax=Trapa TaxID=22665 RepID=A0AAN7QDS6_TRANT|nr:hypothetical protein SAY87_001899 [Trapa incisa]KAK4764612.1 hypothetical protein SAY86_025702 [Trapa natans]
MIFLRSIGSVRSLRHFSSSGPLTLKTGDVFTKKRVFSNEDVINYSKVSHDSNPVHFDAECARTLGFEDCLVHGMLVAALFPRIISSNFPGAIYVSQSLQFKSPVYVGEEISGEVQATNIRKMKDKSLVKFSTKCFKKGEHLVIDGEAVAIFPSLSGE